MVILILSFIGSILYRIFIYKKTSFQENSIKSLSE